MGFCIFVAGYLLSTVGFHNFNLRILNLRVKSEQFNCGCFFDTMSDFNVPGSRPKQTLYKFGKRPCWFKYRIKHYYTTTSCIHKQCKLLHNWDNFKSWTLSLLQLEVMTTWSYDNLKLWQLKVMKAMYGWKINYPEIGYPEFCQLIEQENRDPNKALGQSIEITVYLEFVFWVVYASRNYTFLCEPRFPAGRTGRLRCDTFPAWDPPEGTSFSSDILWQIRFVLRLGILYFSDNVLWQGNPLRGISSRKHIAKFSEWTSYFQLHRFVLTCTKQY